MDKLIQIIRTVRATMMRALVPADSYLASRSLKPISTKYGFDRGKPVDRFFIEKFMADHAEFVKGHCGEIVDPTYTLKYGHGRVTKSEVLDIFPRRHTTIQADLRHMPHVESNSFDCLIVTQTLNVVDDYHAAIAECYRVLKPGGTLIVTMPTISPTWNLKINFWRWTEKFATDVMAQHFPRAGVKASSYGNRKAALAFWLGMSLDDLNPAEYEFTEAEFPLIIGITATKPITEGKKSV